LSQVSGQMLVRSARPTPLLAVLSPVGLVRNLWHYRDLARQFAARDVAIRHKGTLLGAAWTVVNPLLTLAVYTFLFTVIFPSRWEPLGTAGPKADFAVRFWCGYVVYTIFADVANRAPGLVLDRPNLVRKVVFPLEILAVATVLSSLVYGAIGLVLLLIAAPLVTGALSPTLWAFPAVLPALCMVSLGAAWFLSALGVYIRDTRQVVPVVMQLLFFVTPVFYPIERVPDGFQPVLRANPFTTLVEASRDTLLAGRLPDWTALGLVTLAAFLVMQAGYAWFMRTKRGFADVI
jgi:lipopolysaccharide transport system permease protein